MIWAVKLKAFTTGRVVKISQLTLLETGVVLDWPVRNFEPVDDKEKKGQEKAKQR